MLRKHDGVRLSWRHGILLRTEPHPLHYTLPVVVSVQIFFIMSWVFWRYTLLYVYVRKYESGGHMWPYVFKRIILCLYICSLFTACVFIVKQAYAQVGG
jgi:hypothetical protein